MVKINKALIGGSLILLITINIFNFLNLIFNLAMARMLSLADYGVLTLLTSFILVFSIFGESIQTILSKYSANENNPGKLKNIIIKSFGKAARYSLLLFAAFLLASFLFSWLFDISYFLIALVGLMIFVVFFIPITRGALQGRKRFSSLGINMVIEATVKLVFAILFVLIGIKIYGALLGIILGSFAALLLSVFNLKDIFSSKEEPSRTPDIYSYSKPVFVTIVSLILFLTADIFLAKMFFSPETAGAYAIASTIAKIIFIGTQPISKAMFPFTAGIKKKSESQRAFINSLFIIGLLIILSLIVVWLFPDWIIKIYSGKTIVEAAHILPYLAIAMSLLSIANLVLYYRLSLGKTSSSAFLLGFVAVQAILLTIFRSSLFEFSVALITATAIFLWGAVYLLNAKK
jgi:stage V sporulation protein B